MTRHVQLQHGIAAVSHNASPETLEALDEMMVAVEKQMKVNQDRSRLIQIAGAIASHIGFVSPYADDHSASTPRKIIKQSEDQDRRLKDWAYEIRQIADRMPVEFEIIDTESSID